jgi:hypothetical protein
MSDETTIGREPIELVRIRLPRCANVFGEGICTATGSGNQKCYNTRATCRAVSSYRETPDGHLDLSIGRLDQELVASGDITRTASLFAGFEVRFDLDPDGIIWEQGGSADRAAYLGVTSGNLVFRAGDGTVASGANTGKISVDAAQFAGKSLTLYVDIDFTVSGASTVNMWAFDPVELTLTLLGSDDFTASTDWAGTDGGAVGTLGGSNAATGESVSDWNGDITFASFYDSQSAPTDMADNYKTDLYLGRGVFGEPRDEVKILPLLDQTQTLGTKLNLAGADDDYEPIGRRATMSFSAMDAADSDISQDPYLPDRTFDPFKQGTFWPRWLARQKFGKIGALVTLFNGYAGQPLSAYVRRAYVLDKADFKEDSITFSCRDVLSRTEFRRVQVPAASAGLLNADVTDAQTTLTVTGDVTLDYPATGTVRINDEIITYTGRSYSDPATTFTGLTRGTDGSMASDHDTDDLVQLCVRYTNATITDVVTDILVRRAKIPAQQVNLTRIASEDATYLSAYSGNLNTLLTVPTGADRLLGKLSEECGFNIFWDERAQQIDLRAIRATANDDIVQVFTDGGNIIAGSAKIVEYPKQRLNVVNFYFNPRDFAGDLDDPTNFANLTQVINGTTSAPEQYGNIIQTRNIFSVWLGSNATTGQTAARLSLRYADVPLFLTCYVDAKDRSIWVGDYVTVETPLIQTTQGLNERRRYLVVEAEEVIPGHTIHYELADVTLDGRIFVITENGVGTYTPELLESGLFFISDNDGLNSDGTRGATIN